MHLFSYYLTSFVGSHLDTHLDVSSVSFEFEICLLLLRISHLVLFISARGFTFQTNSSPCENSGAMMRSVGLTRCFKGHQNLIRGTLRKSRSPHFRSPDHNPIADIAQTWPLQMFRQQANTNYPAPEYPHIIQSPTVTLPATQTHPVGRMRALASKFEGFFMSFLKPYRPLFPLVSLF
jgi:hypothetical protein